MHYNYRLLLLLLAFLSTPALAEVKVFACEPEWGALVEELGEGDVRVYTATHAGQDPHHIQARPSLIARLRTTDLLVCSGAELEAGWLPMLQRRARNPRVLTGKSGYFEAAAQVQLLDVPEELDRVHGDVHGAGNPHIQLDPRRLRTVAEALSLRLQQLDPASAGNYQQRWQDFAGRWDAALQHWQQRAESLRGKAAIVHHREWVYLLDWLGIKRLAALEPKPGVPPTLAHLASLKQLPQADWIILSPLDDPKPARWLNGENAVPIRVLPQTVGAVEGSESLFGMFDRILDSLLQRDS